MEYCTWTFNEYYCMWETECGQSFQFSNDEGPENNGFVYCYHCGKLLREAILNESTKP